MVGVFVMGFFWGFCLFVCGFCAITLLLSYPRTQWFVELLMTSNLYLIEQPHNVIWCILSLKGKLQYILAGTKLSYFMYINFAEVKVIHFPGCFLLYLFACYENNYIRLDPSWPFVCYYFYLIQKNCYKKETEIRKLKLLTISQAETRLYKSVANRN